ncbi:2'-5' RNA ligase family protein [Deinococcus budaensis]|uniref:2'-5' RNA ligase n=1 Tax=Deinococcus budaensis TaxID=1665626 RepID=A0A7W8GIB4_9DEIO|nr:2'-5' RNA ligase family protein [Deinococcus budaensis]MBB5236171.1 2'-5' RNA ligase [Deinococcus budaensis]
MNGPKNAHAHASFLLGVLPPPDLGARVDAFRARLGRRESAPHVTVKARSGLGADLGWVPAARAVVAGSAPLALRVGGARVFAGGRAVYLAVDSPDVVALHLRLLEALEPAARFGYEGPAMTPHLTLALRRRGENLGAVLDAARAEFADLEARPLTFTAREVWRLRKPGPGGLYRPEEAWPLRVED